MKRHYYAGTSATSPPEARGKKPAMGMPRNEGQGELLASEVRAHLERLNFGDLTTSFQADRNVVRISWPHRKGDGREEGLEVPASREWVERFVSVMQTSARTRSRTASAAKDAQSAGQASAAGPRSSASSGPPVREGR